MSKFRLYWRLIKSLQTFLLLITGMAGYMTAKCPYLNPLEFAGLTISLFLTISGTTVLNMIWDRHIDAQMDRTKHRPIPSGQITVKEAYIFGISLLVAGLIIGFAMSWLYGLVLFAGFFFDYVVYTIWLKQRTAWSILWGGISGGMPILAGRVLAVGHIDLIGILLALGILAWIPTHIMTFNIKFYDDYQKAGVPTFPHTIGIKKSRLIIALSSIISAVSFTSVAYILGLEWGFLRIIALLGLALITLAIVFIIRPTDKLNFHLFKAASLYMLLAMIVISIAAMAQRGTFG